MIFFYLYFKSISWTLIGLGFIGVVIVGCTEAAKAPDLNELKWTERGTVLEAGPPGSWDVRLNGMISPCTVIKKDGIYFLYYIGADGDRSIDGGPRHRALGVATSKDSIHFTKYKGNPIITHLPHRNEEEGVFSAGAALDENGDIVLYYGAMDAGTATSENVDSDIRLAISKDGFHFKDLGDVISHSDKSIWGYGDELFPVGTFHSESTWYVYYIAKGRNANWDLGLAWGPDKHYLSNTRVVLKEGNYIIGGCDPVWLDSNKIGIFIFRDFKRKFIEVRTASTKSPEILNSPVGIYQFKNCGHFTVFFDKLINTWFMYQLGAPGNNIKVMTAPGQSLQ